jgi:hypothetical protein
MLCAKLFLNIFVAFTASDLRDNRALCICAFLTQWLCVHPGLSSGHETFQPIHFYTVYANSVLFVYCPLTIMSSGNDTHML